MRSAVLFRDLKPQELEQVLAHAWERSVSDGAFIFMEDDPATHTYFILAGRVKLSQVTPDGQQVLLGYIGAGREFGIVATLEEVVYPVSAQATGDCRLLVWKQEELAVLMVAVPRIAYNAMLIMARQIKYFQSRIRELATRRVERRLARTLLRLAQQSGRKVANGVLIDLALTRQDLAEMSGTTLFSASRILKKWESQGLVSSKREQLVIRATHGLAAIAEDLEPEA